MHEGPAPEQDRATEARRKHAERLADLARQRLTKAAVLFADGEIDKQGYNLLRDKEQADLNAATTELERLTTQGPAVALPPFNVVLREAQGWANVLKGTDLKAARDVLALLVEYVVPVRLQRGRFHIDIRWTPLGEALQQTAAVLRSTAA